MQQNHHRIFESVEIDKGRSKIKIAIISDWRNNIAIAEYCDSKYNDPFLVDKDYNIIFETRPLIEEAELEELPDQRICRTFGGKYIVRGLELKGCVTYSGKDRDTLYLYEKCIAAVLDENGKIEAQNSVLHRPLKQENLTGIDIENQCVDLGEGLTIYKNAIYNLSDYSKISVIPYEIENISYFSNNRCKFYVKSHYAEFYVLCQDKKIISYYDKATFETIENILRAKYVFTPKEESKESIFMEHVDEERVNEVEKFYSNPQAYIEIENYLISLPHDMFDYFNNTDLIDENLERCIFDIELNMANFYTGGLIHCSTKFIDLLKEFIHFNESIPNFVKRIYHQGNFNYNGKYTNLYLFKCCPYGYINKKGEVEYDFNPSLYNFI